MNLRKEKFFKSLLKIRNIELEKQKKEYFLLLEKKTEHYQAIRRYEEILLQEKKESFDSEDNYFVSNQFYSWFSDWKERVAVEQKNLDDLQEVILESRRKLEKSNFHLENIENKYHQMKEEDNHLLMIRENIEILEMSLLKSHNIVNGD